MCGSVEVEFEEELEDDLPDAEQSSQRRRRRRRHRGRRAGGTSETPSMPPGVFVLDSSEEDFTQSGHRKQSFISDSGSILSTSPPRSVVTWSDLFDGAANRKAGVQDDVGKRPVDTAVAVWPRSATDQPLQQPLMEQWPCAWSPAPPMHCLVIMPALVQASHMPEHPCPMMHTPHQPVPINEWTDNSYMVETPTLLTPSSTTSGSSISRWSDLPMRQLLFNNAGGKVPSPSELVKQLQAVAPESYED